MATFEALPHVLRDLRETRRLSQAELGRRAEVKASLISAYEGGKREPSIRTLGKLLGALDASLLDLHYAIEGTSPPPAAPAAAPPTAPSLNREDVRRAAIEAIERIASFATMGDNAERSGELTGGRANGEPLPVRREVR